MNIINIILKEIKHNIRDTKSMFMLVLFPIVLISILGFVLGKYFNDTISFKNIKVVYTIEENSEVTQSFKEFMSETKNLGISYKKIDSINNGINSTKEATYSCYIRINGDKNIELYKNSRYDLNASFVQSVLNTFVSRYNLIIEVYKAAPMKVDLINSNNSSDYVNMVTVDKKRKPTAMDYYSVTMLTLIIMYAALSGAWGVKREKLLKTGSRMICSPVKKYEIFTGKVFGNIITTSMQIVIVILFSKFVLKAYWGTHMISIFLIILSEIILTTSIGIAAAFIIKDENAMSGTINAIIPFLCFLGGSYMPIDSLGIPVLQFLTKLSPIKWTNQSIFSIIYSNDFSYMSIAIMVNLGISLFLLCISSIMFKKEAI